MNEYTINVHFHGGENITKLEILSPVQDQEYHLTVINKELSEAQLKRLSKSIVEIIEGVFLAERGAEFE